MGLHTKVTIYFFLALFTLKYQISCILLKSLTKVLASYWALLTLLFILGPFGSEGKMFQRISKPQQENRETKRWWPLPADSTPEAPKDSELATNQRKDHLPLAFADQKLTKKQRDGDLVHQKKYKQDDILKRRHGYSQVVFQSNKLLLPWMTTFCCKSQKLVSHSASCPNLCWLNHWSV